MTCDIVGSTDGTTFRRFRRAREPFEDTIEEGVEVIKEGDFDAVCVSCPLARVQQLVKLYSPQQLFNLHV